MTEPPTVLQRIAHGDRSAVAECIERYGGLVWSLTRRAVRDEADAEELVQDVFTELWRTASRYDPARSAEATYVSMITRRRIVDRIRRTTREAPHVDMEEAEVMLSCDDSARLEARAEADRVLAAMRATHPDQYRVLHLSIWLGLSHGAIAERTALPLGTVKSHLRRGLIAVRDTLGIDAEGATDGR